MISAIDMCHNQTWASTELRIILWSKIMAMMAIQFSNIWDFIRFIKSYNLTWKFSISDFELQFVYFFPLISAGNSIAKCTLHCRESEKKCYFRLTFTAETVGVVGANLDKLHDRWGKKR